MKTITLKTLLAMMRIIVGAMVLVPRQAPDIHRELVA